MESLKQEQAALDPIRRGRVLGGILVRKNCWTLSLTGRLILLVMIIGVVWGGIRFAYPFLAVTQQTSGEYLVVEAWIPRYGLQDAVTLYQKGSYQKMITSGCARINDQAGEVALNPAYAAAIQVQRYGMNSNAVVAVPCPVEQRDRTYNTAMAVKAWLEQNGITAKAIDVVTVGPHARRSRLLFQKAFGNGTQIGVIAVADRSYDTAHWWRSSEGVRDVIGEGIAYTYARIFFHPGGAESELSGQNQNHGAGRTGTEFSAASIRGSNLEDRRAISPTGGRGGMEVTATNALPIPGDKQQ